MPIKGTVYLINDTVSAFPPIIQGRAPTSGFVPDTTTPFVVELNIYPEGVPTIPVRKPPPYKPQPIMPFFVTSYTGTTTVSVVDGSFSLPEPPKLSRPASASLTLSYSGRVYYRTVVFSFDLDVPLDIYLYEPEVVEGLGISAGQVSTEVGHSLPSNSKLTTTPWGFSVAGSKSGANLQFGVQILPDTSTDLSLFVDMAINGWNIHVGYPADLCENANDVLNTIESSIQTSGSSTNKAIAAAIVSALQNDDFLSLASAQQLLSNTCFQFTSIASLATPYTWAASNKTDPTIVLTPRLVVGFPRHF